MLPCSTLAFGGSRRRIVVASVDTYLRFAEATNRLDLYEHGGKDLTEVVGDLQEGGASKKTSGVIKGAKKALKKGSSSDDDDSSSSSRKSSSRRRQTEDA